MAEVEKYKIPFINSCIRSMAKRYGYSVKSVFLYLKHFHGIEFLIDFYDTLHLQSIEATVDDMVLVCQKNGGEIVRLSIMAHTWIL